ncbi:HlyD family secretion protein [Roseateles asaccharophilus]|uniref:Membrane fusion protein (Multidrug efflux system) n=1 Tax=Roseateles asaccharophilus TaxID=582607 RepID=A0ABU2A5K1_9BURK|nr:HlyD family secretion protein [Roseateles asaccharophilus]MDR7332475.1 membrane fusion protein (multidrug efflux system) [Roseateles asaccharophilus]
MNAPQENAPKPAQNGKKSGPPVPLLIVGALLLIGGTVMGGRMWWRSQHLVETDNAFIAGRIHPVSARVAGVVTDLRMQDNAVVKAGDVLLRLDPADAAVQVERLKAQIAQADAAIATGGAQVAQAKAQAAATGSQVAQAEAVLARTELDAKRSQALFGAELRATSKQELDAALAARDVARADLAAKKASANAAKEAVAAAESARQSANAQKAATQALLKDAQNQLGYVEVKAASDGRIGKRTVEVGQRVQPGQQLAAVVENETWIVANFKETQLAKMKPGQKVHVHIDAFPGHDLIAKVDSFAPASGASFALLPPDNATGNFTKIVQRVPVKVVFEPESLKSLGEAATRIVPGLSVQVEVEI